MAEQVDQKKCAEELAEQSELKKSIDDLEKEVTCGVCQEVYKDPKLLPCGHYFCMECVMKMCRRVPAGKPISCPECRLEFVISQETVADLKTAFNINRLIDVHRYQLRCYKMVAVKANLGDCSKSEATSKCPEHDDLLLLYCYSCKSFICRDCALTNHKAHKYEYNTTAVPKRREELLKSKDHFEKVEKEFQEGLKNVTDRIAEVETHGKHVTEFMASYYKDLRAFLDEHQKAMFAKHEKLMSGKMYDLHEQEKKLLTACGELCVVKAGIDAHFSSCSGNDMLGMSSDLMELIKTKQTHFKKNNFSSTFRNYSLVPGVKTFSEVEVDIPLANHFERIVRLVDKDIVMDNAIVIEGLKNTVHTAENTSFRILYLHNRHFDLKITPLSTGPISVARYFARTKYSIFKIGCYTHLVEYTLPHYSGEHRINIFVDKKEVHGSPFRLNIINRRIV